jgi:hypothetical protein
MGSTLSWALRARRRARALGVLAVLMLLTTIGAARSGAAAPQAARDPGAPAGDPAAVSTVYLPLVGRPGQPQPTPDPGPKPDPEPQQAGFFVEPEKKTGRPGVAVDPQGGLHMAYRYHVPYAQHPQVVYAYCPPPSEQCGNPAKWGRVAFLDRAEEVQIELTPAGKPRLLALLGDAEGSLSSLYVYAECNADCLNEDSWSGIGVTTRSDTLGSALTYYTPRRSFELDPQGRPRFVYYDNSYVNVEPDHIGGFYLWCDADCTTEGSWYETRFTQREGYNNESISDPVLKFTRDGRPRILTLLYPLGNGAPGEPLRFELYYVGCDSACEETSSWRRTPVVDRGSGYQPAWDLELDPATDSPRAVNYQSGERKLLYHWCEGDCLAGGWRSLELKADGWGVGAELKLDPQGRPRLLVLNSSRGVGVMVCDAGCGQLAGWGELLVEPLGELDASYPVARPVTCDNGLWYIYAPSMAFDAAGNPHIVYDAAYEARCQYVDPTQPAPPTDVFHEIWHSVRYVTLR